jgi:CRISPR-associated protein Cas1
MEQVKKLIKDRNTLQLVRKWLNLGVTGSGPERMKGRKQGKRGILQGSPLSPLLANIYLDSFDKAILKKGLKLVRFGDDFIIQCRTRKEAESALKYAQKKLKKLKLEIHPHKTQIAHFDKGVRFLGNILKSYFGTDGKSLQIILIKKAILKEKENHVRTLHQKTW